MGLMFSFASCSYTSLIFSPVMVWKSPVPLVDPVPAEEAVDNYSHITYKTQCCPLEIGCPGTETEKAIPKLRCSQTLQRSDRRSQFMVSYPIPITIPGQVPGEVGEQQTDDMLPLHFSIYLSHSTCLIIVYANCIACVKGLPCWRKAAKQSPQSATLAFYYSRRVLTWEVGVLEHLLGDLPVELGGGVAEVALNVDKLLQLVECAVHLQHGHLQRRNG